MCIINKYYGYLHNIPDSYHNISIVHFHHFLSKQRYLIFCYIVKVTIIDVY